MLRDVNEGNYALLPLYLVLDSSASMYGEPFAAALNFVPKLLEAMVENPVVADKVRLEVITFDSIARVAATLSDKSDLENWYENNKDMQADGDSTNYTNVFRLIKQEVERGVEAVTSEKINGEFYKTYRPAVFFITDGDPVGDNEVSITQAFNELTSEEFKDSKGRKIRPNIFVVGVGDATKEKLEKYGASRYKHTEYTVHNSDAVLVRTTRDGVDFTPARVLSNIVPKLVSSIISSTNVGTGMLISKDDLEDPLANVDDLFGTEDLEFDFDDFDF